MQKNDRKVVILALFQTKETIKVSDVLEHLSVDRTTVYRYMRDLIASGEIEEVGKWMYKKRFSIREYFDMPFFERPKKTYAFDFLASYVPNVTNFLGDSYETIKAEYLDKQLLSTYDYRENIRSMENLLIDLSFSSSKLEGNTYSYLDTEVLIKYSAPSEGKTPEETQMVLNHKNAIKYIVEHRNDIRFEVSEFQNIHALLGKGLLKDSDLGKFRSSEVGIGWSAYVPLDNHFQLSQEFDSFVKKLNAIKNPFEQTLFILVFVPYFQAFVDINKRTSRISANIPLIKNGFVPFSFLQVREREYIDAILAVYELSDVQPMRALFVTNYLLNMKRYL